MNYSFKKLFLSSCLFFAMPLVGITAEVTIIAPERAVPTRQPITVQLFLDTEGKTVSGIAGKFSFPTDMFTIGDISTKNSVVSLWMNQPALSVEKYLDNRTHITFEGIFPGGYDGVRSPYYQGERPGILFTVVLIPKNKGNGAFIVDDLHINSFTSDATPLPTTSAVKIITVPELLPATISQEKALVRVKRPTLSAFITRDVLVNDYAWYLVINEQDTRSAIEKILVAETDDYNAEIVGEGKWRVAKNPYVLLYQDRTKNVHLKVIYANQTYTTVTLPAVENFASISFISRILVSIGIVLLLLYFYGKDTLILFKKKH